MTPPRNPLTLLFIGIALGGILGAVIGIAIGTGTRGSSAPGPVRTVVSTRTIRVASLSPRPSPSVTDTTPTTTTGTDTTATGTTPTDTTGTDTTTTSTTFFDTTPTTPTATTVPTDTSTGPRDPNDVPPADPYNPPGNFCTTHICAPGFSKGTGTVVQCADGVWTQDGGNARACRNDGGVA